MPLTLTDANRRAIKRAATDEDFADFLTRYSEDDLADLCGQYDHPYRVAAEVLRSLASGSLNGNVKIEGRGSLDASKQYAGYLERAQQLEDRAAALSDNTPDDPADDWPMGVVTQPRRGW